MPQLSLLALLGLAACASGPDYVRPVAASAAQWQSPLPWQGSQPADALPKGAWWQVFGDAALNQLEDAALAANQNLKLATARLAQARANARAVDANLWPTVDLSGRGARQQTSANRPASTNDGKATSTTQNDFIIGATVAYEVDLFGRINREVESAAASSQQAEADFENVRLLLTAEVASNWFALRALDTELDVLKQSLTFQSRAVDLLAARHEKGAASGLDVAQQEAQRDNTRTQIDLITRQRLLLANSLATLTGQPAPAFQLPASPLALGTAGSALPAIPLGQPASLLERRPDIAAAERGVAVANALIGVADAARFPSLKLNAGGGWDSRELSSLISAPSVFWALGAGLAYSVIDGGRNAARLDAARANHEAATAAYRQSVLRALQEVEDSLASLTTLKSAAAHAQTATTSAEHAQAIATDRYRGGIASYLEVVTASQNALNNRRQLAQLQGQQLTSTVQLIKALGGGWQNPQQLAAQAVPQSQ
ncbi:efflux transporter outer membrane subunit [Andreprevotia sp. IGB-42]|uniref:efflux transporter outer membrane subunit n=1 Tax=Andreprevotia sp. IGB-42 TaxID=2497473 RepID=UPI0015801944|nr:efflux transporter outer membrane subunit [Andreprevotia sp. IGB-42]